MWSCYGLIVCVEGHASHSFLVWLHCIFQPSSMTQTFFTCKCCQTSLGVFWLNSCSIERQKEWNLDECSGVMLWHFCVRAATSLQAVWALQMLSWEETSWSTSVMMMQSRTVLHHQFLDLQPFLVNPSILAFVLSAKLWSIFNGLKMLIQSVRWSFFIQSGSGGRNPSVDSQGNHGLAFCILAFLKRCLFNHMQWFEKKSMTLWKPVVPSMKFAHSATNKAVMKSLSFETFHSVGCRVARSLWVTVAMLPSQALVCRKMHQCK